MKHLFFITVLASTLALVACAGSSNGEGSVYKHPTFEDERNKSIGWNPKNVQLSCPSGDCPDGVGLIMFLYDKGDRIRHARCTAGVIGSGDTIMTNNHCGNDQSFYAAYFFYRVNGQTTYRIIDQRTVAIADEKSGIGRDLSLWRLRQPVNEVQPRTVARHLPANLDRVVTFVVNGENERTWTQFVLDKRSCTTRPHVPIVSGGVADKTTGLALYGCEIRGGNSGSPVFAEGDLQTIQLVLNTIWNFDPSIQTVGQKFKSYFLSAVPAHLQTFFAMAERIHCLPIPGQADVAEKCASTPNPEDLVRAKTDEFLKSFYEGQDASALAYGARLFAPKEFRFMDDPRLSFYLVPQALCANMLPVVGQEFRFDIPLIQLGYNEEGVMAYKQSVRGSWVGNVQAAAGKLTLVSEVSGIAVDNDWKIRTLVQPLKLNKCGPDALQADLDKSRQFAQSEGLGSVNSAVPTSLDLTSR